MYYDEAMFSRAERCAEAAFRLCLVMSNTYGITLDSEWIEWAATEKVSETVAAPVLLICESRPVHEVVAKLTPGEFERVVDIVRRSPDHFPSGTQPRSRAVVRCPHAGRDRIASSGGRALFNRRHQFAPSPAEGCIFAILPSALNTFNGPAEGGYARKNCLGMRSTAASSANNRSSSNSIQMRRPDSRCIAQSDARCAHAALGQRDAVSIFLTAPQAAHSWGRRSRRRRDY